MGNCVGTFDLLINSEGESVSTLIFLSWGGGGGKKSTLLKG